MSDLVAVTAIDRRILGLVRPVVEGLGYEMVRLRYRAGKNGSLQIMAERPDGRMEVENCVEISRAVSAALDVADPFREPYALEVSSPGIDRPLSRLSDFKNWIGHLAKLQTSKMIRGRRRFGGIIRDVVGETIILEAEDGSIGIEFSDLDSARLVLTDELLGKKPNRSHDRTVGGETEIAPDSPEQEKK